MLKLNVYTFYSDEKRFRNMTSKWLQENGEREWTKTLLSLSIIWGF